MTTDRPRSQTETHQTNKKHKKKVGKRNGGSIVFDISLDNFQIDNDWQTESDGHSAIATTSKLPRIIDRFGFLANYHNEDVLPSAVDSDLVLWTQDAMNIDLEYDRSNMVKRIESEWPEISKEEAEWLVSQRRVDEAPNPRRERVLHPIYRSKKIAGCEKFKGLHVQNMRPDDSFRCYIEYDCSTSVKVNEPRSNCRDEYQYEKRADLMESVNDLLPCEDVSSEIIFLSHICVVPRCGPLISADIAGKISSKKDSWKVSPDKNISVEFSETTMRMVKIYAPDRHNWSSELALVVKQHIKPLKDVLWNEKVEMVIPNHDFKILMSIGGVCEFMDSGDSCTYLVNVHPHNNSYEHFRESNRGVIDIRQLSDMERAASRTGQNDYRIAVTFSDHHSAKTFVDKVDNNEAIVTICPNFLLLGSSFNNVETSVEIRMTWLKRPPGKRADVWLKYAHDMKHAMDVFYYNQVNADGARRCGERLIHVSDIPSWIVTNADLNEWVDTIVQPNEIQIDSANLHYPFRAQNLSEKDLVDIYLAISARIVETAIDCGVWSNDPYERPTESEMHEYVLDYTRFPWKFDMCTDRKSRTEHILFIRFSDYDLGCTVAEALNRDTNRGAFSLNKMDRRGVISRGCIRMSTSIPSAVRRVCAKDIEQLDKDLRDASTDDEWARLVDGPPDTVVFRITVQGFPKRKVEYAFSLLQSVVDVIVFKCDTVEKQKFLYGVGQKFVNEICRRLINSVLVDIDQTRNIISLYGTREGKEEFIRSIEEVIHNQDSLHVETTLCLKPPRYLHSLYHFMKRVQETEKVHVTWADTVGAQVVNFVDDNAHLVQFVGYLPQYERFLNMLDEIDVKLHESVDCHPASIPSRPTCVACLNPVHANFYCLEMCGHYMCRECINQQMFSCIRSRAFPIKCVCCEEDFAVRDIKNLLLGDTNGLPWLDSSKLFTFIRSSIDLILKKGGSNYAACLTPDCDGIFQRTPQAPGSSPPPVKCGSCSRIMCRSCAMDEHPGQTCEKIKYIRENADESLKAFIREMGMQKVRKCPNEDCLAIIEKDAGCNHIQCAQCGIHFCWICQHQTTTENKMYKHLSEQHGGADGGWRFENEVLVEVPDGNEDALLQQPFFGELWNV